MRGAILAIGLLVSGSPMAFPAPSPPGLPAGAQFQGATVARPIRYRLVLAPNAARDGYDAELRIEFELPRPAREVVLHGAGLTIHSAMASSRAARVSADAPAQLLRFGFDEPMAAGRRHLDVRFSGRIAEQGTGLVRVEPRAGAAPPGGIALYSALCCGGRGRFLMPMWDLPSLRASFDLTLRIGPGLEAISAMPVAERSKTRVRFRPTPPLPPHLFVFAIGRFERVSGLSGALPISIVLPSGEASKASYALGATRGAVDYLERYLDEPFPLPKLDSILLPGARGGAISNWGAIQYAERYLLVGEGRSTDEELFTTSAMVAHEVAHQWFGNLVSPAGPADRWLSEGIAVWLENNAVQSLRPGWRSWLRAVQHREAAMRLDAGPQSHAIDADGAIPAGSARAPAFSPRNEIVYDKSAQVLRMLERYAGGEAFQLAVQSFLDRNRHGVVDSDDFWAALEAASLVSVADAGRDFVFQAGVPLIDVLGIRCERGRSIVLLRQSRFGTDEASRTPREWRVPVTAMSLEAREPAVAIVRGERPVELAVSGCGAVKVNVGQVGYYRTRYDENSFEALRAAFRQLAPEERLGMMYDEAALADAEYVPYVRYLGIAASVE
jgi:aminopeptidase N